MAMMSLCAVGDWVQARGRTDLAMGALSCGAGGNLTEVLYEEIAAHREALKDGSAGDDILTMLIEAQAGGRVRAPAMRRFGMSW